MVEIVAHRGANELASLSAPRPWADAIELDVHLRRGRVEVRHSKRLPFTRRFWERWYLLPQDTPVPTLRAVLAGVDARAHLMVDLKGWSLRLSRLVIDAVADRDQLTVSTKAWWLLLPFRALPQARSLRSAGNRFELWLLRRRRLPGHGVVVHSRLLDAELVAELRARNGQVFTWAITDSTEASTLVAWGVDGLIVDDPGVLDGLGLPPAVDSTEHQD